MCINIQLYKIVCDFGKCVDFSPDRGYNNICFARVRATLYKHIKGKEKGANAHRDAPCIKPIISEAIGSGRK